MIVANRIPQTLAADETRAGPIWCHIYWWSSRLHTRLKKNHLQYHCLVKSSSFSSFKIALKCHFKWLKRLAFVFNLIIYFIFTFVYAFLFLFFLCSLFPQSSWTLCSLRAVGKSWLEILINRFTLSEERSMLCMLFLTHTSTISHR